MLCLQPPSPPPSQALQELILEASRPRRGALAPSMAPPIEKEDARAQPAQRDTVGSLPSESQEEASPDTGPAATFISASRTSLSFKAPGL